MNHSKLAITIEQVSDFVPFVDVFRLSGDYLRRLSIDQTQAAYIYR